jgi:dipeptidyl aminopeptidase/acylaminoacyl peptidase
MEAIQKPLDPAALALSRLSVNDEGTKLKFVSEGFEYEYDLATEILKKLGKAQEQSPLEIPQGGFRSREDFERFREEQLRRQEEQRNNQNNQNQNNQNQNQDQDQQQRNNQQELQQDQQQDDERNQNTQQQTGRRGGGGGGQRGGGQRPGDDHRVYSPDRKAYVFAKGHNLFYVELKDEPKKDEPKKDEPKSDDKQADEKKADEKKSEETKTEEASKNEAAKADAKKDDAKKEDVKSDEVKNDGAGAPQEKSDDTKKEEAKKEDAKKDEAAKQEENKPADKPAEARPAARRTPPVDHDGEAIQLTTDGAEDYSFAGSFGGRRGGGQRGGGTRGGGDQRQPLPPDRKTRPNINWSRDSKAFYVSRRDSRGVSDLWVVNSLTNPRPTIERYKYAMPGEEKIQKSELHVFHKDSKKLVRVPAKWKDESLGSPTWGKSGDELRLMRRDRLLRHVEYCSLDTKTGQAKCLITEGFENAYLVPPSVRNLDETDEMIWWSERSGWGHFYLYDKTGKLKNAITSGPFRASRIVDVDAKNRMLYFLGNGREENENIYFEHLYCVHLDGSGLTLMDPGDASHRSVLSPSKRYLVDNCSRVDRKPCSVLRDASGKKLLDLEQADLSRLAEIGWKLPETFVVKAADGVTDLYGNLWKPFSFDPKKKYPIIAHVYPGPQQEGTNHTFSATAGDQQLAQLGFIVIQVGHRGGAPTRSKAYASYGYFNMRDYGLADKKAAIEQLAARHPYIDITRTGIYGHSGGGFMTAAALLQRPYNEFFKVGVSTSGNHDNNVYNNSWAERYHGLKEVAVTQQTGSQTASRGGGGSRGQGGGQTGGFRGRGGGGGGGGPDVAAGGFTVAEGDYFYEDELLFDDDLALQDAWRELAEQIDPQELKQEGGQTSGESQSDSTKTDTAKTDGAKTDAAKAAEQQMKFEIRVPTNAELAANLKGHLLLVHGEMDNNVHPANTLRLVDALIKANKRFDMLYLPGQRHSYGEYQPYVTQRMFEYFAEHLLGDYQPGADISQKAAVGTGRP